MPTTSSKDPLPAIDYPALRDQKLTLLEVMTRHDDEPEVIDKLQGLLNLIDAIQDYAADELGIPEEDIFLSEPIACEATDDEAVSNPCKKSGMVKISDQKEKATVDPEQLAKIQKTYLVEWSKAYYTSGDEFIKASSAEEAEEILLDKIGDLEGSLQYNPADDYVEASEWTQDDSAAESPEEFNEAFHESVDIGKTEAGH